MSKVMKKIQQTQRRQARIRRQLSGSAQRPRLSATFSNRQIVVQLIDDASGTSLATVNSAGQKLPANLNQKAEWAGAAIAKAAAGKKIKQVVFDRRGKPFHGRVKTLADAARKSGLEF